MFGHLEPSDATSLIVSVLGGAPLRARFRGSLWLDPLEQLAEIAALDAARREHAALWPTIGSIDREVHDDHHATLRVKASFGTDQVELELACTLERKLVVGDCRSADTKRRGSVAVWKMDSVRSTRVYGR